MVVLETLRRRLPSHEDKDASTREIRIRVQGGYDPDEIHAQAGVPLRLIFRREETSPCSEQVVFPSLGKSATLPSGEPVAIDFPPLEPGEYAFTCAMGMLHGVLIVDREP
jgi:plastocyanin domain-containing protein